MARNFGFTPREWRALRALGTPVGIQRALEAMPYHIPSSAWSPRRVLHERTARCLEGAIFAAAALRVLGFAPLPLDLEAVQDTGSRHQRLSGARPLGRHREVELLGPAIPRARLPQRARARDELLRQLHQLAGRADAPRLFAADRSGTL